MNIRALSSKSFAIANAAMLLSGSACAGPLLCEEVVQHASAQLSCPDSNGNYFKNKHPIDHMLHSTVLGFSSHVLDGGGKWTMTRLRDGQSGRSIPEPGSLLLLGIGLVAAAVSRRLR